jgi:hypothetical protein
VRLTTREQGRLTRIHSILTGNGEPKNVEADARHIFEAQKYGSYFVTTDKRLLSRTDAIRAECGVEILRPSTFLARVRRYDRPDRS